VEKTKDKTNFIQRKKKYIDSEDEDENNEQKKNIPTYIDSEDDDGNNEPEDLIITEEENLKKRKIEDELESNKKTKIFISNTNYYIDNLSEEEKNKFIFGEIKKSNVDQSAKILIDLENNYFKTKSTLGFYETKMIRNEILDNIKSKNSEESKNINKLKKNMTAILISMNLAIMKGDIKKDIFEIYKEIIALDTDGIEAISDKINKIYYDNTDLLFCYIYNIRKLINSKYFDMLIKRFVNKNFTIKQTEFRDEVDIQQIFSKKSKDLNYDNFKCYVKIYYFTKKYKKFLDYNWIHGFTCYEFRSLILGDYFDSILDKDPPVFKFYENFKFSDDQLKMIAEIKNAII
jgi:hypothetical protein